MSTYYESISFDQNMLGWVYRFSDYNNDFYDIHWHRDIELTYLFKGTCKAAVNGQAVLLNPEDILIVNGGDTHYFHLNYKGDICDALVIILPYNLLKKICPSIDYVHFQSNASDSHYPKFISILKKILEILESSKNDPYIYLKINSLLYEVIYMLFTYYCTPLNPAYSLKTTASRGIDTCKKILDYIDENFQENITLESAAAYCNMSKEYISRLMKDNLNITFKQYLTDIRLNYACLCLLETQSTILQISMDSGFPNCKSFITAFSRKYSLTPQLYRNSYQSALTDGRILSGK